MPGDDETPCPEAPGSEHQWDTLVDDPWTVLCSWCGIYLLEEREQRERS